MPGRSTRWLLAVALVGACACGSKAVKVQQSRDSAFLLEVLKGAKDEWLVEDAARNLGAMKVASAVPDLVRLLSDVNAGPFRRAAAARALQDIGDARAVKPLVSALGRATDAEERCAIAFALGRFRDPDASAALESLMNDPDVLVARAARKGYESQGAK